MNVMHLIGIAAGAVFTVSVGADPLLRFEVELAGLYDSEHTNPITGVNVPAAGDAVGDAIVGTSRRYGAGGEDLGQSVWIHLDGSTTRVGFRDPVHTRDDGFQRSTIRNLGNVAGPGSRQIIVGTSEAYDNGGAFFPSVWAWAWENGVLTRIGLFDALHTSVDGTQMSSLAVPTQPANGLVYGRSTATTEHNGIIRSAWVYDGVETTRLGFFDATHTNQDTGRQVTEIDRDCITVSGYIAGESERAQIGSSGLDLGRSAWIHDGATTTRIGLFDALHTRFTGQQSSLVRDISESGFVVGNSFAFEGGADQYDSAWLYDPKSGTRDISPARFATGGRELNSVFLVETHAGEPIVAFSMGGDDEGEIARDAAWIHENGVTQRIGLLDALHTMTVTVGGQPTGQVFREGSVFGLSETGVVVGRATAFVDPSMGAEGESVWVYHDGVTERVGFYDGVHVNATRSTRFNSSPDQVTPGGTVYGTSARYNAETGNSDGITLWAHRDGVTRRIGLFDEEHTGASGTQFSDTRTFAAINNLGDDTVGFSRQYAGGSVNPTGQSVWYFDGLSTKRLGLLDSDHTGPLGQRRSAVTSARIVNGCVEITGTSERYDSMGALIGQSGWYYDAGSDEVHPIVLAGEAKGSAGPVPSCNPDGFVLGNTGAGLASRAYLWTAASGFADITQNTLGGLASHGLQAVARPRAFEATPTRNGRDDRSDLFFSTAIREDLVGGTNGALLVVRPVEACGRADLAVPFGRLEIADIIAFLNFFGDGEVVVDVAEPFGTFDIADVVAFLNVYAEGCP